MADDRHGITEMGPRELSKLLDGDYTMLPDGESSDDGVEPGDKAGIHAVLIQVCVLLADLEDQIDQLGVSLSRSHPLGKTAQDADSGLGEDLT